MVSLRWHLQQLSKVRVVPPEGVELFGGGVLVSTLTSRLAELRGDLVEGAAFGLGHLEVGEGEEAEQQNSKDDEDVGPTKLLHQNQTSHIFSLATGLSLHSVNSLEI